MSDQDQTAKATPNWSYSYSAPRKWWEKGWTALIVPTTVVIVLGLTWNLLREARLAYRAIAPAVTTLPIVPAAPPIAAASAHKQTGADATVEPPTTTRPHSQLAATPTATTIDSRNIPYATSLIYRLARIEFTNGTLSIRQAEVIRQALKELIALGPAAVPAIRKFLLGFENVAFENLVGGNLLEYPTLRLALLDVLGKIGGSDAERVLHGQLEATAEPVEIAALARTLERLAPGQYREPILHATQELLAQISNELLSSEGELINVDTAPLFTVLQKYGDETVVAELEKVPPWLQQYATVTLANLAGGEGIQYLARMSSNPTTLQSEGGRLALQMLTQVAVDNLEAQEALFDTVSTDQIPASMWPRLAEVLAGNSQVQLQKPDEKTLALLGSTGKNPYSTNTIVDRQTQVLYSVNTSAVLTDPEIDHRLALIDRLMEETADPAAIQALEKARSSLQLSGHRLG